MIGSLRQWGAIVLVLSPIFYFGFVAKPSIRVQPTGVSNRGEAQINGGERLWQEYAVKGQTSSLLFAQLSQCATDAGLECKIVERHATGKLYLHIYGASSQSLYITKEGEPTLKIPGGIKHPKMDDAFRKFGKKLQDFLPDD